MKSLSDLDFYSWISQDMNTWSLPINLGNAKGTKFVFFRRIWTIILVLSKLCVDFQHGVGLTQLTLSLTPRRSSRRGVSLGAADSTCGEYSEPVWGTAGKHN